MLGSLNDLYRDVVAHTECEIGWHAHLRQAKLARILGIGRTIDLEWVHHRMRVVRRSFLPWLSDSYVDIEERLGVSRKPPRLN